MLELESKDINSTLPVLTETDNETYVFNEKEEVVYNWNVIDINTLIILRTCDNKTSTRFYNIQFENGHFDKCTTEILRSSTDTDITRLPTTSSEIHPHTNRLTQQEFKLLINSKQLSQLETEWLDWHTRYDHLSWSKMDRLVIASFLPNKFNTLKGNDLSCMAHKE